LCGRMGAVRPNEVYESGDAETMPRRKTSGRSGDIALTERVDAINSSDTRIEREYAPAHDA
jgi:hypothetical protein